MSPSLEPMSPCQKMNLKLKVLRPLCNQKVNLKTDSKPLHYKNIKNKIIALL